MIDIPRDGNFIPRTASGLIICSSYNLVIFPSPAVARNEGEGLHRHRKLGNTKSCFQLR
jgi:hypothetical protein